MPDPGPQDALRTLLQAIEALRDIDPLLPTQTAQVLLVIARRPGLTMQELAQDTGLSQASCSRNVMALSKWHRLNKAGYDLVESLDDPRERRRKVMYLTPKGRRAVLAAVKKLDPNADLPAFSKRDLY